MKAIFFSICIICLLANCKPDDGTVMGSVTLDFNASFGNNTFEPVTAYNYSGVQAIKFSKFDFYITGVEFLGAQTELTDAVGLIDFTASANAKKMTISNVKIGNYTGIRFIIGVKPELNKKLPKDFDSNNPLASTSHYWDSWNSYIFSKIEGVVDTAGKGNFDHGFAIHTGTNDCLVLFEINKNIEVKENQSTSLLFDLDVKKIFTRSNGLFDIKTSPLNHNPANLEILKTFSSRIPAAISIKN